MEPSFRKLAFSFSASWKSPAQAGLFVFLLAGFVFTGEKTRETFENAGRDLVAPPPGLERFTFGFRHAMADTFWVRSIQDFDYCEQEIRKQLCRGRGWLYQTLDMVTTLDGRFRMAYSAGGMALSVIISDIQGASLLFDKAVQNFPEDWIILYKAAYHALYEEKDAAKAARLMQAAAEHGAPDWVYVLAGRLYTEAGRRELAVRVLEQMKSLGLQDSMQERLRQKIEEKIAEPPAR